MARQILPIAGQIIGGMVGGPVGAAIGGAIGGALGAYVDPLRHQGPKLGEARAQTAQEGVYRPLVFGTGCVSGNIIHRSERKVVVHRESAGGKGNRDTVDTERGYRTFAIRIAEAHTPDGYALLRIWENETLVYDARPESEIPAESAQYSQKFRFYSGTQNQLPDPDLEAYMGVGNVNSYRGSSYIVFGNYDLTDYGDMIPQFRFEVASSFTTIDVSNSIVVGEANNPSRMRVAIGSQDGTEWGAPWPGVPGFGRHSGSIGKRSMVWNLNNAWVTDDFGETWDGPHGSFGGGGVKQCYSRTGIIAIPHVFSSLLHVTTDGRNYATYNTGAPALSGIRNVAINDMATIVYFVTSSGSDPTCMVGSAFATSGWRPGGAIPVDDTEGNYFACSDRTFALGGRNIDKTKPAIAFSIDVGMSWSVRSLEASSGEFVVYLETDNNGKWVALIENGEVWYSLNDCNSWVRAPYTLPTDPRGIGFNGERFIIASGSSGNTRVATAEVSDLSAWTERAQPMLQIDNLIVQVPRVAQSDGEEISLRAVLGFCHERVGSTEYSAESIVDMLDGVVFADGYSARDAIISLLPIYNADASEFDDGSGYRINYVKRGAPVVRTLTIGDLVDEPEETVREDPMERPRVLHLAFESPITGYTAAKASIQRLSPDVRLVNEVSTYVPVTFKDVDEAWRRADVQMRIAWTEVNGERTFSIADDHLDLIPTDVVAISLRGQVHRLRVQKVEYADGVMKLEAIADRQSNYTSNVTGIPLPAPEPPPPSLMGPAVLAILDIPAISDQHDRLGYYVAVCGTTEAYAGVVVQRQQNGEWADVVSLGRNQRAIMGVLENTVTAGSEHYTDTTNTVSVALYMEDELESLSDAQWLNKGGAFALETAAGWEIMQYRDAHQDSGGVWHLTHLARGRLNTVADEHLPGARFVLLSGVRFIDADVGMLGQPLTLRAAAIGRSPEGATPHTITYQGNSQREFPVAHIFADLNGTALDMNAVPRDRLGAEVHPLRSVNHDGFRWTATDGVATVTVDTDHATGTLDVSGLSAPINATVAQLNRFTGVGPTVSESVE